MRLIDADTTKKAICRDECGADADDCERLCCRFPDVIDEQPTVDAVPIEPLAKWLAGYAMPPGGLKAHKVIGKTGIYQFESRVEAWEEFLRRIDWKEKDNDG